MELKLISKVKEVKETTDIQEVNSLVEKDWILLKIVPRSCGLYYSLGRLQL